MKFSEPLQIKFAPAASTEADAEIGYFTAYASTRNKDAHGDIVAAGAFADSIKAMESGQRNVPLLWMHDHKQPLGAILSAREDETGLFVSGQVVTGSATADRAYALLKKGALSLSIGFLPVESDPFPGRGALLKRVDLYEISLVACPANAQSTVISVRSLPEFSRVDWERALANGQLPPVSSRLSGILAKACMSAIGAEANDEPARNCERCGDIPDDSHIFSPSALAAHDLEITKRASKAAAAIFTEITACQSAQTDSAQLQSALDRLHQTFTQ